MTRTRVHFFGEEQLQRLVDEHQALDEDFRSRERYMDKDAAEQCRIRLGLLGLAIHLLGDVAD